jgi:hypothetical protein
MSTEVVWVNRNIAVLARLHHIRGLQPTWKKQGDGQYHLTLQSGQRGVSDVFNADDLLAAFKGGEQAQTTVICRLTELVRSLEAH